MRFLVRFLPVKREKLSNTEIGARDKMRLAMVATLQFQAVRCGVLVTVKTSVKA